MEFRFIIALLIRRGFGNLPALANDRAQKSYADLAIAICRDKEHFLHRIRLAEKTLANAVNEEPPNFDVRNAHQDRRFVEKLLRPPQTQSSSV